MVGLNMNGPTRDQVIKFMEEKEKIEKEIEELTQVLEANGNIGMHEPLVDAEGFPRADIDVYRVRHARHRIICLQNDHKDIMKQIENGIHRAHQEYLNPNGEGPSRAVGNGAQPMEVGEAGSHFANGNGHALANGHQNGHQSEESRVAVVVQGTNNLSVSERPFVKVNFLHIGSPAENAGIEIDDEILQFGSVNSTNFSDLTQIGRLVQNSEGARVNVRLRRGNDILNVTLVPQRWTGLGLLGCNIIPI